MSKSISKAKSKGKQSLGGSASIGIVYLPDPILKLKDHLYALSFSGHITLDCFPQSLAETQWLMFVGVISVLVHSEANKAISPKDCDTIADSYKYMEKRLHTLKNLVGAPKPMKNTMFPPNR